MAYPDLEEKGVLPELLFRKEYADLRTNKHTITTTEKDNANFLDYEILRENKLNLQTYQKFVSNWINPNNLNRRLLIKFDTGTGKTAAVLTAAMLFIKQLKVNYQISETIEPSPEIFIIGFSRNIFIRELTRRPEFGFITRDDIRIEMKLRVAAQTGSISDRDELSRFHSEIRKRLSKRIYGGFFKFYGYKELFNRLLIFTDDGLHKLSEHFKSVSKHTERVERSSLSEEQILIGLKLGFIGINMDLIDSFVNGLCIFDEFHNVYNSSDINNYGTAIRIIQMIHENPDLMSTYIKQLDGKLANGKSRMDMLRNSMLRSMFLSATPINNSPTEIIDLLCCLIPLERIVAFNPNSLRLVKSDFFIDNRNLKKGALESIADLIKGCVAFLSDTNPKYFPTFEFTGTEIEIPKSLYNRRVHFYTAKKIPYLRFIRCPMSKLHYATYMANAVAADNVLVTDGASLLDIVFASPESETIGLFRTRDTKHLLKGASAKWKASKQIEIQRQLIGSNISADVITGGFLALDKIWIYSTKYYQMLIDLMANLKSDGGKIIINHQFVRMSGVLLIKEMLMLNGILDEYSQELDTTLCAQCGLIKKGHAKASNKPNTHEFVPARFIILHSDIDKSVMERSLEKFRAADNIDGYRYRIVLGSKIINESMDFSEIREIKIMTVPANISTLIQIIGRGIRKGSHMRLPPEKRRVAINIYTSSLPVRHDGISYEERKYFEKSMDYLVIQQIEKIFNQEAVDSVLNRDIIFPTTTKHDKPEFGRLWFDVSKTFGPEWRRIATHGRELGRRDVDTRTFDVFDREEEVSVIMYCIKRLFYEQSHVWKYDDLWKKVQNPPFDIHVNASLFDEENFVVALDTLLSTISDPAPTNLVDSLFDTTQATFTVNGRSKIFKFGELYVLLPLATTQVGAVQVGASFQDLRPIPVLREESWLRIVEPREPTTLNITKLLQTTSISYEQLKLRFYQKFHDVPASEFPIGLEVYGMDFHIRLVQDAIKYCFNIMVNADMQFSELHTFYFKLLYFYDKFDLILYASDIEGTPIAARYKKFITTQNLTYGWHRVDAKSKKVLKQREAAQYDAFLKSSMSKSAGLTKPFDITRLNAFLGRSKTTSALKTISNTAPGTRPKISIRADKIVEDLSKWNVDDWSGIRISKIFSNLLPIGHFLNPQSEVLTVAVPVMYNYDFRTTGSKEWTPLQEYASIIKQDVVEVENDLLIGYYDKNPSGIELKFKLRAPIQKIIKHQDSRLTERGSVCNTRKKEELYEIAALLSITNYEDSIRSICDIIKLELMKREIIERHRVRKLLGKKSKDVKYTRWFYFHFEKQPL